MKPPREDAGQELAAGTLSRNQKAHYYRRLRATRPDLARLQFVTERDFQRRPGAHKK